MNQSKKYCFYVVWQGFMTGVFADSFDFLLATKGHPNAKYKGFRSRYEADKAFKMGYRGYFQFAKNLKSFENP